MGLFTHRQKVKVTIDIEEGLTEHEVDAEGERIAVSRAMKAQGITKCCRATVETEKGRKLYINVRRPADVGIQFDAEGYE
jgi:hypothetical protein